MAAECGKRPFGCPNSAGTVGLVEVALVRLISPSLATAPPERPAKQRGGPDAPLSALGCGLGCGMGLNIYNFGVSVRDGNHPNGGPDDRTDVQPHGVLVWDVSLRLRECSG